jgi:hypothetical protein
MRVTQKYLLNWLKAKFEQLEIEYVPYDIQKTRFHPSQYEAGAANFLIRARHKTCKSDYFADAIILVPFPLWDYQGALNNGYELFWEPRTERCGYFINDSNLIYRKK